MGDLATIPTLLEERGQRLGAAPAIVSDDDVLTYRELDARSLMVARRLVAAGVNKGTRVGLLMPNSIAWALTAFAVMRAGAVLVPLSTLLRPPELEAQLATAGVAVLIAVPEHRGRHYLRELADEVPGIDALGASMSRHPRLANLRRAWTSDELPTDLAPESVVAALEQNVRPADDMAVMFTSGSRGRPKGVIHTHGNAIRATSAGLAARGIGEGDRLYIPMPFFWMGGFGSGLLSVLIAGATLLTETDPTPPTTIRFLEREQVTLFRGWPDQAAKIASDPTFATADLSSLRSGSLDAVLPPSLRSRPGARANLFGMTESFGPYCGSRLDIDLPEAAEGSCGRPFDGTEVRITDPGSAEVVGPGEPGIIELRGPNLMRGICGRLRQDTFTVDGFFPTGDLGWVDGDGYLFYAGRVDDMFKVSGATVYPTEVEASLRSIAFVRQAFVTNLADASGTQTVGAVVVVPDGHSVDDVVREARARLSSFKVPKRWVLVASLDEVPTMATGKVDKSALQTWLASSGQTVAR